MKTNKPEVVAYATHHDEPMLFPSKREAAMYCDAGEEPLALIHISDYESLQAEREKLRAENRNLIEALSDYYSQNKCGCGHPACKRCRDDRFVEEVLADTQPAQEGAGCWRTRTRMRWKGRTTERSTCRADASWPRSGPTCCLMASRTPRSW